MFLVDTHVLLWAISEPTKLSKRERTILEATENNIFFSVASIWEIAIKVSLQKLKIPESFKDTIELFGFQSLPVTFDVAFRVKDLHLYHKDPFDHLIIATALENQLTVITHDLAFKHYPLSLLEG